MAFLEVKNVKKMPGAAAFSPSLRNLPPPAQGAEKYYPVKKGCKFISLNVRQMHGKFHML